MVMSEDPWLILAGGPGSFPKSLTLICPKHLGERIRSVIMELGLFDPDRSIGTDDMIHFPIRVEKTGDFDSLHRRIRDIEEEVELTGSTGNTKRRVGNMTPYEKVIENLKDKLDDVSLKLVPRTYELIGDCCILKVPGELRESFEVIGQEFKEVLRSRFVLNDTGGITGDLREPDFEVIVPPANGDYEVIHKEGEARYFLDPRKIMFSSGNIDERMFLPDRIADIRKPPRLVKMENVSPGGEVVVDMFAGIGYFTIPLALANQVDVTILAVEKNPTSDRYLRKNVEKNKLEKIIIPILGDNREVLPPGIADRIIMGYVGGTIGFLPRALELSRPEGCIIHLHDTVEIEKGIEDLFDRARSVSVRSGFNLELLGSRRVKSFAPRIDHVAIDVLAVPV
jgi:tRNA wybutosine-synthesizing protein 2